MATIQVRDISEQAYEIIRRRARAAGQSIQAYLKNAIERMALQPDEDELFADLERFVETHGIKLDMQTLLEDLDEDRR